MNAVAERTKEMGSDPIYFSASSQVQRAWEILASVSDPEIPVISVLDLGIVRDVIATEAGVDVFVTPTYAGCPAVQVIEQDIVAALHAAGIAARAVTTLSPAWSTDWITPAGRAKLKEYGIAPPGPVTAQGEQVVQFKLNGVTPHLTHFTSSAAALPSCPLCESARTERLSQFGSTACKALYRCLDCREPFDYFKPL